MQLTLPFLTVTGDPAPGGRREARPAVPTGDAATVFVRNPRARRYIMRLRPDGTLRVTIPRRGSQREADAFVARQRRWIERQRGRVVAAHAPRDWTDGCDILLDGQPARLTVTPDPRGDRVEYAGRSVRVAPGHSVRAAVEADLIALARERLAPRLRELAEAHGLQAGRVSIRNQRSRWGSCAGSGNIALNFRLVQMPAAVRDYVIVHELMHLQQQNHSRRFWRLVAAACPTFRDAERWLRTDGKALF